MTGNQEAARGPTEWATVAKQAVSAAQSTQVTTSSPTSARTSPEFFAAELTPCLALVGGVGMGRDDRRAWLNAAYRVIGDVPPDMLAKATREAMKTADHPSKIIPAITKALQADRDRPRFGTMTRPKPEQLPYKPVPVPPEETQAILRAAGVRTMDDDPSRPAEVKGGSNRPARMPTAADYIRMGVDPAALDQITGE